jgi:hypothetical protein
LSHTVVQLASGTAAQVAAYTGAAAEVVVNTSNNSLSVQDGSTAGGHVLIAALAFATMQQQPTNPTGTTNTSTGVMMGLGGVCTIPPGATGRVFFQVSGIVENTVTGYGAYAQIRYGTGTAPANGASPSGSNVGAETTFSAPAAGYAVPFCLQGIVTGLTPGTTYWVDLFLAAVTGGTASVQRLSVTAFEL